MKAVLSTVLPFARRERRKVFSGTATPATADHHPPKRRKIDDDDRIETNRTEDGLLPRGFDDAREPSAIGGGVFSDETRVRRLWVSTHPFGGGEVGTATASAATATESSSRCSAAPPEPRAGP